MPESVIDYFMNISWQHPARLDTIVIFFFSSLSVCVCVCVRRQAPSNLLTQQQILGMKVRMCRGEGLPPGETSYALIILPPHPAFHVQNVLITSEDDNSIPHRPPDEPAAKRDIYLGSAACNMAPPTPHTPFHLTHNALGSASCRPALILFTGASLVLHKS